LWLNAFVKTKYDQSIDSIATIPLVFFVSSFVAAFLLKYISLKVSHKVTHLDLNNFIYSFRLLFIQIVYAAGSLIAIMGCAWITFFASNISLIALYGVAILLGTGSSVTQISSLCITSDFIGSKTEHGGFIYSLVTVCDKLFSGIIIFIIELM